MALCAAAGFPSPGRAGGEGTEVSGPITQDTNWSQSGSPYRVVGDISVEEGATLTLDKGTSVVFEPGIASPFVVRGSINATGTPLLPILFSCRLATSSCWKGIEVYASEADTSLTLDHADVEFAEHAVVLQVGASSYVSDSQFRFNVNGVELNPLARADRNRVFGNSGTGVTNPGDFLVRTLVTRNGGPGILMERSAYGDARAGFTDNTIMRNGLRLERREDLRAVAEGARWTVDVTGNFWGVTNPEKISRRIVDGSDEAGNSAAVEFEPFATRGHAQTPSLPKRLHYASVAATIPERIRRGQSLKIEASVRNESFRDCTAREANARFVVTAKPTDGGRAVRIGSSAGVDSAIRETRKLRETSIVTVALKHDVWYCRAKTKQTVKVRR